MPDCLALENEFINKLLGTSVGDFLDQVIWSVKNHTKCGWYLPMSARIKGSLGTWGKELIHFCLINDCHCWFILLVVLLLLPLLLQLLLSFTDIRISSIFLPMLTEYLWYSKSCPKIQQILVMLQHPTSKSEKQWFLNWDEDSPGYSDPIPYCIK